MNDTGNVDDLLRQLGLEFLESCEDSLDVVDTNLTHLIQGDNDDGGGWDDGFNEILRRIHSIKGSGGTFGFPAVTLIAHGLEDYIETSPTIGTGQLNAIQAYADAIRDIVNRGENPGDGETTKILRALPVSGQAVIGAGQTPRDIGFLLVMQKGLQRRIIGKELVSCGFRVGLAETGIQAIELGIANPPDIIAASMVNEDISGVELARVFRAIGATAKAKFLLMTSSEGRDPKTIGLPLGARVVRKGDHFSEDLSSHLMEWGVFGNITTKPTFTAVEKNSVQAV